MCFHFRIKIEVIYKRKDIKSVSDDKCSVRNPRLTRKFKMSAIPNIKCCCQDHLELKQLTVCISIQFLEKYTLTASKKKAFLWVYLHFLCVRASFTVELRKHLICYFVCPPSLSVNINTDFLKCNLFFSKTHNSWKP